MFCLFVCFALFSNYVVSESSHPHGLQHTRLPCSSPSPLVCSNSFILSQWCHPTISSSVIPFSCFQSFPWSGSFLMSLLLESGDQNIGNPVLASVLPKNIQDWSPCCPRDSQEFSPVPQFKSIHSSTLSLFYSSLLTSIHDYWKDHNFDYMDLCWQGDVSTFKYVVEVCHMFSSKEQASFNLMTAIKIHNDFEAYKNEVCPICNYYPSICHEVMGPDAMILVFWMLSFKPSFSLSSSLSSRDFLVPLHFLP